MQLADLQIDGARLAAQQFKEHGITFPLTVGEEISTSWADFNAYPLKELVGWELPLEGIVNAAHAQGAVIQWNHPGYPGSDWDSTQQPKGLEGTGLDAWEHVPPRYDEWKQAGKLPVLTGATDTHSGTFNPTECTIILAPSADGADIAAAIRRGDVIGVSPRESGLLFGSDRMASVVRAALAEGKSLKAAKAERLKAELKNADLAGLIKASAAKPEVKK